MGWSGGGWGDSRHLISLLKLQFPIVMGWSGRGWGDSRQLISLMKLQFPIVMGWSGGGRGDSHHFMSLLKLQFPIVIRVRWRGGEARGRWAPRSCFPGFLGQLIFILFFSFFSSWDVPVSY